MYILVNQGGSYAKHHIQHHVLTKITDDTEFIIQCYHTMLGRSLDPFEMQHAIQMLSNGLSKKASYIGLRAPRNLATALL